MNCESARELLSAYFDQEVAPEAASAVSAHVASCEECARRLAEFEELSELAANLRQPEVPPGVWSAIESSLPIEHRQQTRNRMAWWFRRPSRVVLAATLLLGTSLALLAFWEWRSTDPHVQMTAVFDQYLGEFQQNPEQAQEILRIRYDGRPVSSRAVRAGRFSPNAPIDLPNGFTRMDTYVLDMPCCTCTQTTYKNATGEMLALFEHSENQRMWFGERPIIEAQCHGRQTFLVQLKDQLAASWKCGPRHLTVIGARNVEQVAELIAFLDAQTTGPAG